LSAFLLSVTGDPILPPIHMPNTRHSGLVRRLGWYYFPVPLLELSANCVRPAPGRDWPRTGRDSRRSHISDDRLTAFIHMHVLYPDELRATMPQPPQSLNLGYIDPK
jgi:hypothetical protein